MFLILLQLLLLWIAVVDYKQHRIPNALVLSLVLLGLLRLCGSTENTLLVFLHSLFWLFFLGAISLCTQESIGMGDAKLIAALALWYPWSALSEILLLAFFAVLILSFIMRFKKKRHWTPMQLPLAPFLFFSVLAQPVMGWSMSQWLL